MNQETPDKREYVRIGMQLLVSYVILDKLNGGGETIAKDVSGGGIRLPIRQRLVAGTLLRMHIELMREGKKFVVEGKVVWLKPTQNQDSPYEAGIEFIGIDPLERNMISNHIQYLSSSELVKEYFRR